ncbi:MAG: hypothetical protein IPM48_01235 [Saprospiraceae bacterium]|nr:hypothetical protein [Saprospiraceae bacterium]
MRLAIIIAATFMQLSLYAQSEKMENVQGKDDALEKLEARRAAFITTRLNLSTEESTKFWPIYNEYSRQKSDLRKSKRNYRKNQSNNNQTDPRKEIDDQLAFDEKELAIKKAYYEKFAAVLPAAKLAKLEGAEREFNQEVLKKLRERKEK